MRKILVLVASATFFCGCGGTSGVGGSTTTSPTPNAAAGPSYASLTPSEQAEWNAFYNASTRSADPSNPIPMPDFVGIAAQADAQTDFNETLAAWKRNSLDYLIRADGFDRSTLQLRKLLFMAALFANAQTHTVTTWDSSRLTYQTAYILNSSMLQFQFRSSPAIAGSITACNQSIDVTFNRQGNDIVSVTKASAIADCPNAQIYTADFPQSAPIPQTILTGKRMPATSAATAPVSAFSITTTPLGRTAYQVLSSALPTNYIPLTSPAGEMATEGDRLMGERAEQSPTTEDLLHPHHGKSVRIKE